MTSLSATARRGALVVRFDPAAFGAAAGELLERPEALVGRGRLESVHASRGARVYASRGAGISYYWKELTARGRWDPLKSVFRLSRAERAERGASLLEAVGLETPRILAIGLEKSRGVLVRSFLVTEAVRDLVSLESWMGSGSLSMTERRALVGSIGRALAAIHGAGLVHGDLRPSNLLCAADGGRLVFLDNERTRPSRRKSERLRNLVQLGIDEVGRPYRTDRIRLLRAYVAAFPRYRGTVSELARVVDRAILKRRRRRVARGLDPRTGSTARDRP